MRMVFFRAVRPDPRRSTVARRWACLLAICAGIAAAGASAADVLTLDEAVRLAEQRSLRLAAQESAASAAREMAQAAGERADPAFKASLTNLPIDGADRFSLTRDFMTMRSIGVMQEFTRSSKREARAQRFAREAELALAVRELALAELRRDTALAWLDRHFQERIRAVLVDQRDEARLQVDAADAAYRGGGGAQADVYAARSMVAQIEDRIAQTEQQVAAAGIRLARWVGEPAARALGPVPSMQAVRVDPSALETQLAHHPRISLSVKEEEIARAEVEIARSNRKSDWSVELMLSLRGPAYSNMVSVNVSVPLQWDQQNRQDRELSARLAGAEEKRAQREEASREHVAEALAMLHEWRSHRGRLTRYDDALIPLAAERTRASVAAYRGASGSLADVLDARRSEIETRVERLRLEMETARSWAQLEYLLPAGGMPADPKRVRHPENDR